MMINNNSSDDDYDDDDDRKFEQGKKKNIILMYFILSIDSTLIDPIHRLGLGSGNALRDCSWLYRWS